MILEALLIFATFAPSPVTVDVVEINHFHNAKCEHVFTQVIFYDWSPQLKKHIVREWRAVKSNPIDPVPYGDRFMTRWNDDGVMREVIASSRRETWTQVDPERENHKYVPEKDRLPLWSEKK